MKLERAFDDHGAMPIHIGGALLCAASLACGWFMGLGPMLNDTHQATSLVAEADDAERALQVGRVERDHLTSELESVMRQLEQQPVSLVSADQINPLLGELAQWADTYKLSVTRTNAGRPVVLAYYDYVPIKIAGEGSYADLLAFFRRLQEGRGDLQLTAFSANRLSRDATLAFEVELAWYVLSESAQPQLSQPTAAVGVGLP